MIMKVRIKSNGIVTEVCYDASEVTVSALEKMQELYDEVNVIEYINEEVK